MKNLKPTKEDSFLFYKNIVNETKNPRKKELNKIEKDIKQRFKEYKNRFNKNDVCSLKEDGAITVKNKEHLKKLYTSRKSKIGELKKELTTNEKGKVDNICQFCTFETVSSLDHFLPKSTFEEYSVNPLNLFPICSTCNTKKSDNLKNESGECLFLNLYTDILPKEQYLFVNLEIDKNEDFVPNFYLKNIDNKIDDKLFKKIENHYKELKLITRFKESVGYVMDEFENSKKITGLSEEVFIEEAEKQINSEIYNINNFKVVLEKELLNNLKK